MSRPENTTAPPPAQYLGQKPECRYESDLDCIISPIWLRLRAMEGGCSVFVSAPIPQKILAVELYEMLTPQFPGCVFRITEIGAITREINEFSKTMEEHKDLIIQCRNEDEPGLAYLTAIGFAPQNNIASDRGAKTEVGNA